VKKNWIIFACIFVLSLAVYFFFCKKEYEILHYFLPLANSFLHSKLYIEGYDNLNELVVNQSRSYVVYPPMPAVLLVPFALFFGVEISQVYPTIIFASLAGAFFFLFLLKLTKAKNAVILSALLLFGTNFFMTSLIGRSWYFAHICAVLFLAIALYFAESKKPVLAGLFYVFAGLSRLPVLLAFPALLFLLKPKIKDIYKFFTPVVVLLILYAEYNFIRFGSFTQTGYSLIPGVLDEPWFKEGIFSVSYILRNLEAIFLYFPKFINQFPFVSISPIGLALWIVTPALLLLVFVWKNRLSRVMILTSLLVLLPSLLHGSVGFSQFGYRFSLDAILLLITALIPIVETKPRLAYVLIAISVLINFYVVILYHLGYFQP